MSSKAPSYFKGKIEGKRYYGEDNLESLKMLLSTDNGYEGRYDFPVTITKIVKNEDTNE
jgi:hypothetical protein